MALPSIKRFLSNYDRDSQSIFLNYSMLYMKIYLPMCGFTIEITDRYKSKSLSNEACVIARKKFNKGQEIPYLEAWIANISKDNMSEFNGPDFSMITNDNGSGSLLLGPARFVNHSCQPNTAFKSRGKRITLVAIRPISPGQEITVFYGKSYFSRHNKECQCLICEIRGVNGFGEPYIIDSSSSSDEDEDDEDENSDDEDGGEEPDATDAIEPEEPDEPPIEPEVVVDLFPPRRRLRNSTRISSGTQSPTSDNGSSSPDRIFSASEDQNTPASSVELDNEEEGDDKKKSEEENITVRHRLRSKQNFNDQVIRFLKFTFPEDDETFSQTIHEWRTFKKMHDDYDYDLFDFIYKKLSDLKMYTELQRFYYTYPIDEDPDLTLDCVNCGVPFIAPDDSKPPLIYPNRLCPRCHKHAILYNSYWPSCTEEPEPIELKRAWDFTSLNMIGVRGEFIPPETNKNKARKSITADSRNNSRSTSRAGSRTNTTEDSEYDSDSSSSEYESDSEALQGSKTARKNIGDKTNTTTTKSKGRGRPRKPVSEDSTPVPKRSRGRPRLSEDHSESSTSTQTKARKRGRPRNDTDDESTPQSRKRIKEETPNSLLQTQTKRKLEFKLKGKSQRDMKLYKKSKIRENTTDSDSRADSSSSEEDDEGDLEFLGKYDSSLKINHSTLERGVKKEKRRRSQSPIPIPVYDSEIEQAGADDDDDDVLKIIAFPKGSDKPIVTKVVTNEFLEKSGKFDLKKVKLEDKKNNVKAKSEDDDEDDDSEDDSRYPTLVFHQVGQAYSQRITRSSTKALKDLKEEQRRKERENFTYPPISGTPVSFMALLLQQKKRYRTETLKNFVTSQLLSSLASTTDLTTSQYAESFSAMIKQQTKDGDSSRDSPCEIIRSDSPDVKSETSSILEIDPPTLSTNSVPSSTTPESINNNNNNNNQAVINTKSSISEHINIPTFFIKRGPTVKNFVPSIQSKPEYVPSWQLMQRVK